MVVVEKPIKTIEAEILRLGELGGPNGQLYTRGAIDALMWVVTGKHAPSEWEGLVKKLTEPVHGNRATA